MAAQEFNPLLPQSTEIIVDLIAFGLLACTIVGGAYALNRESRSGRPVAGWLLAFLCAGPLALLVYLATQLRSQPSLPVE